MHKIPGLVKGSIITHLPTGTKVILFDGEFIWPGEISCPDVKCLHKIYDCKNCIFHNMSTGCSVNIHMSQFEVLDE